MLKVVLLLTLVAYIASCLVYMFQPEFQVKTQDDKVKPNWNKIFKWSLVPTLFVFLVGLLYVTIFCKSTSTLSSKFWKFNGNNVNNSTYNGMYNGTNGTNGMNNRMNNRMNNSMTMDNYESTDSNLTSQFSTADTESLF